VAKAKDMLVGDSPDKKKAEKLFKKAIDKADEALKIDNTYYEALNLQGFSWRKLGDYKKSLDAYAACLKIQPDYAPAREYYGQALLESGDREGAEAQLAYLKRLKADDLAKQLEDAIAAVPVDPKDKGKTTAKDAGTSGGGQ
jgi:tetratricopeptide (TPR) repeat protein